MTTSGTNQFSVYKITNNVNGKFYIGITGKGVMHRWRGHVYSAKRKAKHGRFPAAIIKYGKDNFTVELLELYSNSEDCKNAEIRLIRDLKPHYNVTAGGDGTTGHRLSDEVKERLRQRMLGRQLNLGRKWTDEQKARMSAKKKGCPAPRVTPLSKFTRSENLKRASKDRQKRIICLSDGNIYDSLVSASSAYNLNKGNVSAVCTGNRKSSGGMKFAYLEAE